MKFESSDFVPWFPVEKEFKNKFTFEAVKATRALRGKMIVVISNGKRVSMNPKMFNERFYLHDNAI